MDIQRESSLRPSARGAAEKRVREVSRTPPGLEKAGGGKAGLGQESAGALGSLSAGPGQGQVEIPVFPLSGSNGSDPKLPVEPDLKQVLRAIDGLSTNMSSQFQNVNSVLHDFKNELVSIRSDMVTKEVFHNLEQRVQTLECKGEAPEELRQLRQQVSRLDPASKTIRVRSFKCTSIADREAALEKAFTNLQIAGNISYDHVHKGPPGKRELTDMCLVQFGSNATRETVLGKLQAQKVHDKDTNELKFDRAKTLLQISRNTALRQAADNFKKDPKWSKATVEIIWQKDDKKDKTREVRIDGEIAFNQKFEDSSGTYVPPFGPFKG